MISKKFKDVLWVFNHPNPKNIPSYLVSGVMPADILGIKKLIFLENHDPKKTLDYFNPKIILISKVFDDNVLRLIKCAKEKKIKIISIFDDWNFDSQSKTDNTKRNIPISKHSDLIIVKTKNAAEILYENTSLVAKVIPDMLRFKTADIFSKINKPLEVVWFGMNSNHDTILNELINIENTKIKVNLKIISNLLDNFKKKTQDFNLQNVGLDYIEWQPNCRKDIIASDIVILPYPRDKERLVKSSNRIIDSLNLGRFVILSDVKQFVEFKEYVFFGNIAEGLLWVNTNDEKSKQMTIMGQNYVKENYSISVVSKIWEKVISKLL